MRRWRVDEAGVVVRVDGQAAEARERATRYRVRESKGTSPSTVTFVRTVVGALSKAGASWSTGSGVPSSKARRMPWPGMVRRFGSHAPAALHGHEAAHGERLLTDERTVVFREPDGPHVLVEAQRGDEASAFRNHGDPRQIPGVDRDDHRIESALGDGLGGRCSASAVRTRTRSYPVARSKRMARSVTSGAMSTVVTWPVRPTSSAIKAAL